MSLATDHSTEGDRLSRPAQVAESIKAWVMEQGLQVGDRLPNEAELIAHFGRAKGTIREAMRILEAQGLVRTRTGPGGGCFVHAVSQQRAQSLLANYFYFQRLTIGDIYQLREQLEPSLARQLAGQLDEAALAELEANIGCYPEPARDLEEERSQHIASLHFHRLLATHASNPLLGFVIDFLAAVLGELTVWRRLYRPQNRELWSRGHDYQRQLLEALRTGDADRAEAVSRDHMLTARAFMEQQEALVERRFL